MSAFRKYKVPAASLLAMLLVLINVVAVFAHHNTYEAKVNCAADWEAKAYYVGGDAKRLVLISMVEINGVLYDPDDTNWSEAPDGLTGGVIPRSEYGGPSDGLPNATDEDYLWIGVSNGWKIFNRSGVGNFLPNPGNWEGVIKMFEWSHQYNKWKLVDTDEVWQPNPPGDCPKPDPKAKIEYQCDWDKIKVTFKNEGSGDAIFNWTVNGQAQDPVTVGPYSQKTKEVPIGEDQTVTIVVNGPRGYTKTEVVKRNCAGSDASLTYVCNEDKAKLKLENTSDVSQTFQYTVNGAAQAPVVVDAHSSKTVLIPINEDQTLTVVVNGPNGFSKSMEVTRNCKGSDASATYQCDADKVQVTFTNSSNIEQTFNWTVNGQAQNPVVVAANSQQQVNVPIAEDQTLTIVVNGPHGFSKTIELTRNCAGSDASLTYVCNEDKAKLKLENTSNVSQTFNVTVNGVAQAPVVVDAHSNTTVLIPINEDQTLTVVVSGPNGFSKTMEVTRNCDGSDATAVYQCGADQAQVTFSNTSNVEQSFTWTVNGQAQNPVVVAANSQQVVNVPITEDQTLTIVVNGPHGFSKTFELMRDCEGSQASLTYVCGEDAATLLLVNSSDVEQSYSWTLNGDPQTSVVVAPNSSQTVSIPIAEDQTLTVVVSGPNGFAKTMEVTRNCAGSDFNLTYVCGDGFAVASFINNSTEQQTFVFNSNTQVETLVVVEAGQTVTNQIPIDEDETITATVTVQGSDFTKTVAVERDCLANPDVEVLAECKVNEDQFKVLLINTGGSQVTFTVLYGNETNEHLVAAENTLWLSFPLPERTDQSLPLKITAPGMEDFTATISGCGQPTSLPETEQPQQFGVVIHLPFTSK